MHAPPCHDGFTAMIPVGKSDKIGTPPNQKSKGSTHLKTFINSKLILYGPLPATLLAVLWFLAIEFKTPIIRGRTTTMDLVRATDRLVQKHVREFGDTPQTYTELRLYALARGESYSAYDVWGERLEYLRLGKVNYFLRSFGRDGLQNRPQSSPDIGVYHWGQMAQRGLRYDDINGAMHARPSVVLFAGADNSSGTWHARIFVDPTTGNRRLLVRSREHNNLFMLAPHDYVEEFLWIPGQDKIAFTASQSQRYSDGLYIWDLRTDEASNLFSLDPDVNDLDPGSKQRRLYVAMSAVRNSNPPSVAVFAMASNDFILDPHKFFHPSNLHVFSLGERVIHTKPRTNLKTRGDLYDLDFLGTVTLSQGGEGTPLQQAWLSLPLGGDWEKGVISWQNFAAQYSKSQLAPYAIWGLAMLYDDAAKREGRSSRAGQILASYGVELGAAMTKLIVAPSYIRAIGAWIAESS